MNHADGLATPLREFGRTGLRVSVLGLGCARLGGIFANQSRAEALSLLDEALECGINFYDTSDMYCQGESEQLIGQAFAGRRDRVILATKVGYSLPAQRRLAARVKPLVRPLLRRLGLRRRVLPTAVAGNLGQNFTAVHIQSALERSLRRLRTDCVDLYQLHSPPRDVIDRGEFLDVLERLKEEGKIRAYGVSCETTGDAVACLRYPQLAALQVRINQLDQTAIPEVLPRARSAGIGIIARECFAGGELAKAGDASAGAALGSVLDLDSVSVALVGMRTQAHLRDTLALVKAWQNRAASQPVRRQD